MLKQIRPAILMIVVMTIITGLLYPLGMTGIAQVLFPYQANGSLIEQDGKIIGSELIGQNFTSDRYFHGRPSATTETDPKDPTKTIAGALCRRQFGRLQFGSDLEGAGRPGQGRHRQLAGGKSLRPGSGRSRHHLGERARPRHYPGRRPVPGAAGRQGAGLRRTSSRLVEAHIESGFLGVIGEPHVNVLKLNLALDELETQEKRTRELSAARPIGVKCAEWHGETRQQRDRRPSPDALLRKPRHGARGPPENLSRRRARRRQDLRNADSPRRRSGAKASMSSSASSKPMAARRPRRCLQGLEIIPRRTIAYKGHIARRDGP